MEYNEPNNVYRHDGKGNKSYIQACEQEVKERDGTQLVNYRLTDGSTVELWSHTENTQVTKEVDVLQSTRKDDENVVNEMCEVRSKLVEDTDTKTDAKTEFRWRQMTRRQILILLAINSTYLLVRLNYTILIPFFPLEANKKGVNSTTVGWIFGVFSLVQFVVSPFYRHLLPKLSSGSLLMLGLLLCGSGTLSFGFLSYIDTSESIVLYVLLCFVLRILLALSCALVDNTGLVMLVQYFPENVATLLGMGEVFTGIGYIGGLALGGFLYANYGYILPFAVTGGIALVTLPFFWIFVPKENVATTTDDTDLSVVKLLLDPVSFVNSVVVVLVSIAWTVFDPTLEPHLRQHDISTETVGIMFVVMAIFYSITCPIWGRIADIISDKRMLNICGVLITAVAFIWIGPSPIVGDSVNYEYVWYTIISLALVGTASSMTVVSTYCIYIGVLRTIGFPQNNKSFGMVAGLWVSMYSFGSFVGPCLGGFLFDQIGFEWLVTWIAVACIVTFLLVCTSIVLERRRCYKTDQPVNDENTDINSIDLQFL